MVCGRGEANYFDAAAAAGAAGASCGVASCGVASCGLCTVGFFGAGFSDVVEAVDFDPLPPLALAGTSPLTSGITLASSSDPMGSALSDAGSGASAWGCRFFPFADFWPSASLAESSVGSDEGIISHAARPNTTAAIPTPIHILGIPPAGLAAAAGTTTGEATRLDSGTLRPTTAPGADARGPANAPDSASTLDVRAEGSGTNAPITPSTTHGGIDG